MDNSNLHVEFYDDAFEIGYRSEQEGRPVYEQRTFVRIMNPGDKSTIIETLATDKDKRDYPRAYEAYQRQAGPAYEGTPLTMWPPMNKSQCKEAAYFEIHTVEQLAGLTDSQVSRIGMGWQDLRTKAKAYLIAAKDSAHVTAQAAEISNLQADLQAMKEQLLALNVEDKRGPGRPRKDAQPA